jgi:hypothetical protein
MSVDQNLKLAVDATSDVSDHKVYADQKAVFKLTRWYRSPLFNVLIVGLISFTHPGIWNALNSTRVLFHEPTGK